MDPQNQDTSLPEILTPEQVAKYLQLSVEFVLTSLEQRQIPGVRIGNTWRVRRVLLDQWLDEKAFSLDSQELLSATQNIKNDETSGVENITYSENVEVTNVATIVKEAEIIIENNKPLTETENLEAETRTNLMINRLEDAEIEASKAESQTDLPDNSLSESLLPKTSKTRQSKRIQGTVKDHDRKSGYGFIRSDNGQEVFFQVADVENYGQTLKKFDRVEFEIRSVPRGWQAYNVVIIKPESKQSQAPATQLLPPPKTAPAKSALIAFERALAARELGDIKRARELFEDAIRKGPFLNVFQAYSAMEEKENPKNAMRVIEKGIQHFPDAGILYNDYAMLRRRLKDLNGAIETLRQGLSAAPAFARQLHWSLAVVLTELGQEENLIEAAEHAKQAKQLGQYLQDDKTYLKLQILTGPAIGKNAYRFFEKAGFEIKPHSFSSQCSDLLVSAKFPEYSETYDLRDWMLVRCYYSKVNIASLNSLQNTLRNPFPGLRGLKLNQDAAFLVAEDILPLRDALYRLMSDNREAIVPVDFTSLEANHYEDSSKTLRTILDQWLSRRDLYRFNYPVSGRRFFGRELDLQRLMRDIDDGHNVGVFGLRKVGKTSLLQQLRELRTQDVIVYLDIQQVPSDSQDCAYMYWAIAREIYKECELKKNNIPVFGKVIFQLGNQAVPQFQKRTPRLFDHDIRALISQLGQENLSTRIVVILDEVDRLLPSPGFSSGFHGYPDFFAYLRGTSQSSKGQFVNIITAANPALCEQAIWEGRDNPIFQFYHQTFLPPLTHDDCNDMNVKLGRGMGISYNEESLEVIFQATSGHPYLTRLLCSQISQLNPSRPLEVTFDMVARARNEFLRGEATPIFNEILERLDTFFPIEHDLLLFIADGVDSEIELSKLVNEPVDVALYHLIGYQLVEQIEGRYRIKINLLYEWLRKYRLGRE
ncbi:MAG: cold shock domain-containing protein [Anaerolineae bacterium]